MQQQLQQQPPQINAKTQNGGKQDVDIFSMLSKAQEDFNNSGASVSERSVPQINQKFSGMTLNNGPPPSQPPQQQILQQQQQPLMRQLSSAMPDITSPNVVNFFAAAQQPNGAIPVKTEAGKIIQSHNNSFMVNQKVAPVQTLDEIEKQHRVSASPPGGPQKAGKNEETFSKNSNFSLIFDNFSEPKMIKSEFNNLLNSVAQQQQQTVSPQPIMKLQQPVAFQSSNKPALITPAMFQASKLIEEKAVTAAPPSQPVQSQVNVRPEPLTQNQLIQALNYLMETDPEFIRKVHEAYVKSFNKIVPL